MQPENACGGTFWIFPYAKLSQTQRTEIFSNSKHWFTISFFHSRKVSGSEAWGVSGTTRGRGATPGWGAKTVVQDWSVVQEPS